ncbi:MAG: STAS-like domain-containing protein [Planctomycetes bacterium]|nr:STAS-like domain-containing protein [Planctomycetota bacterium]
MADLVGTELVSRSQAKRLLARCEQFQEVTLDFSRVSGIAPAFADEALRVWPGQHPGVVLRHSGASESVSARIERARRNGAGRS